MRESGVVISLREAQMLTGKPRQVMMYGIKLHNPRRAEAVRDELETAFPEVDFALFTRSSVIVRSRPCAAHIG